MPTYPQIIHQLFHHQVLPCPCEVDDDALGLRAWRWASVGGILGEYNSTFKTNPVSHIKSSFPFLFIFHCFSAPKFSTTTRTVGRKTAG